MKSTKTVKVTFIAQGINVGKIIRFIYPYQKESKIEIFRNNMLAKYNLLFKKEPHLIKIENGTGTTPRHNNQENTENYY